MHAALSAPGAPVAPTEELQTQKKPHTNHSLPPLSLFPLVRAVSIAGPNEKKLLNKLLDTYNTLERPVINESDPLTISFGLTLMQIIDVDEKNQQLITNIWLKLVSKAPFSPHTRH